MKEKVGEVFSIANDNLPVPGCTISKEVHGGENEIIHFSLAKNTDISAEIFPYHKLLVVAEGGLEVYGANGYRKVLHTRDSVLTSMDTPVGMKSDTGAVYTEIEIRRNDIVNEAIKAGEVFRMAEGSQRQNEIRRDGLRRRYRFVRACCSRRSVDLRPGRRGCHRI